MNLSFPKYILSICLLLIISCNKNESTYLLEDYINNKISQDHHIEQSFNENFLLLNYKTIAKKSDNLEEPLSSFVKLKKEFHNLKFTEALIIGTSLLNKNLSAPHLIQVWDILNKIHHLSYSNYNKKEKILNYLGEPKWKEDYLSQYHFLLYLRHKANLLSHTNEQYRAMSSLSYALYKITKSKHKHTKTKAEILHTLGSIQLNERIPGILDAAKKNLSEAIRLFESIDLPNEAYMSKINLANTISLKEGNDQFKQLLDSIKPTEVKLNPLSNYYYSINLGLYYYLEKNHSQAIEVYKDAYSFLSSPCSRMHLDITCYIADSYLDVNALDSANVYINILEDFYSCPEVSKNYIDFFLSDLLLKREKITANKEIRSMELLLKHRSTAENIFKNKKEFHLGDFYVQNCSDILNLVYNQYGNKVPEEYKSMILKLFDSTKNRELKRKQYESNKRNKTLSGLDSLDTGIMRLIIKLGDFTNLDYTKVEYEKLYKLYEIKNKTISSQNKESFTIHKPSQPLNKEILVINFLSYNDQTFFYKYYDNHLGLYKITTKKLKDLITQFQLSKFQPDKQVIQRIKNALTLNQYTPSQSVVIIADNYSSQIPFDLILPEGINWSFQTSITEYSSYQKINLNENIILCSYSDSSTINNIEPKDYVELSHGFEEVNKIKSLIEGAIVYSGISFTKKNLSKIKDPELLHLTSHAVTNTVDRQDCYFLTRTNNRGYERIHYYDISSLDLKPLVVVLSSCSTGGGAYFSGEGVFSLARAFLAQGSQTIIKSTWDIDDKASKVFFITLYKEWLKGIPLDEALSKTKEKIKAQATFNSPYYWAGFVIEGNPKVYLN